MDIAECFLQVMKLIVDNFNFYFGTEGFLLYIRNYHYLQYSLSNYDDSWKQFSESMLLEK